MNATLQRFGYPGSVITQYVHWAVMVRPSQLTLGCTIIAAKSACTSLGGLSPDEAAELPQVIGDLERTVRRIAPASKFNYLALMMSIRTRTSMPSPDTLSKFRPLGPSLRMQPSPTRRTWVLHID